MSCASVSACVVARQHAPSVVSPRNSQSSAGGQGPASRPIGPERRAWARASNTGVDVSLASTLPSLKPWAEARVEKCAGAWEKAAALAPNPPIAVVDLVPDAFDDDDGSLSGHVENTAVDSPKSKKSKKKGPFETEFGAFIYDKGYRQLFRALGYPGADAEATLALERLNKDDANDDSVLLDVSCGPGIITTRIAAGLKGYETLIASDVSTAMTKRAAEQLDTLVATTTVLRQRDPQNVNDLPQFAAVRADVTELPFADASVDAVHSSAGAHCWPDPLKGFGEITRVLKPGGVFVASTVVLAAPIRDKYVENGTARDSDEYQDKTWDMNTPFWDAQAVVQMLETAGLKDVEVIREDKCFVMLAARKQG